MSASNSEFVGSIPTAGAKMLMTKNYRGYTIELYFDGPGAYRGRIVEADREFTKVSKNLAILICETWIDGHLNAKTRLFGNSSQS